VAPQFRLKCWHWRQLILHARANGQNRVILRAEYAFPPIVDVANQAHVYEGEEPQ
jgi:hypothetical protein